MSNNNSLFEDNSKQTTKVNLAFWVAQCLQLLKWQFKEKEGGVVEGKRGRLAYTIKSEEESFNLSEILGGGGRTDYPSLYFFDETGFYTFEDVRNVFIKSGASAKPIESVKPL